MKPDMAYEPTPQDVLDIMKHGVEADIIRVIEDSDYHDAIRWSLQLVSIINDYTRKASDRYYASKPQN